MSYNFSDPAGVQALLDQIRSSSAWQELTAPPAAAPEPTPLPGESSQSTKDTTDPVKDKSSSASVASLLSQLYSSPDTSLKTNTEAPIDHQRPERTLLRPLHPQPEGPAASRKDVHSLHFEEAIPILLRLSREPSFIDEMKKIKQDQDALERQLWEERRNIHKKYEDKLKAAQTKVNIIGVNLSKHEADMIVDAHKKELRKFDRDRALPAWDSLVSQQQLKLEKLQVPTMHTTSEPSVRELQQRVLQVLTSIIGPSMK